MCCVYLGVYWCVKVVDGRCCGLLCCGCDGGCFVY